jgi:hypothetical protein
MQLLHANDRTGYSRGRGESQSLAIPGGFIAEL